MSDNKEEGLPSKHGEITVTKDDQGNYVATYEPKTFAITEYDTVLTFKLVTPTPDDVVIRSVAIVPENQDQLSTPSVSKNGKHVTLSDVNTLRQNFSLDFTFGDKKGNKLPVANPEMGARAAMYPEIDNDPPG
jgi:hypothetical protein